jgi:DNA-binding transcriptional regulator YiaG
MPELNALIGKTLAEKKSSLTGKEIRYLRKNMGFTAKKLSEIMGIDNATISRWEADLQKPAKTHDHFFRLLYLTEKRVPVDQVKQIVESIFPEIDSQTSDSLDMVLTPEPWNSTSY